MGEVEAVLNVYIDWAIDGEKAGRKADYKKASVYAIPEEFQNTLDEAPALHTALTQLTPDGLWAYIFSSTQAIEAPGVEGWKMYPANFEWEGME